MNIFSKIAKYTFLSIFCSYAGLRGAASSSHEQTPAQKLFNLAILLDQDGIEHAGNPHGRISSTCGSLFQAEKLEFAALMSSSLVHAGLKKTHFSAEEQIQKGLNVFEIANSPLILLAPKATEEVAQLFNPGSLIDISEKFILTQSEDSDPDSLFADEHYVDETALRHLEEIALRPRFGSQEGQVSLDDTLSTIFNKEISSDLKLNIILVGHGSSTKKVIAGLPALEAQKLLLFLNRRALAHTLTIQSCCIGGPNLTLLERDTKSSSPHAVHNLNFTVITPSASDQIVSIPSASTKDRLALLFAKATEYRDRGASLHRLLLESTGKNAKKITELKHYPHVWLAGGPGFQILSLQKDIFLLNKTTLLSRLLRKEGGRMILDRSNPLFVSAKMGILLDQTTVPLPVKIEADQIKETTYLDPASILKAYDRKSEQQNNLPLIGKISCQPVLSKHYPVITSMIRGNAIHLFNEIELIRSSDTDEETVRALIKPGVLSFIQGAFFSKIAGRQSRKTFLIESLRGYNDIKKLYTLGGHALETADASLPLDHSKDITLNRVLLSSWVEGVYPTLQVQGTLAFEIHETAWEYQPESPSVFERKDLAAHRTAYENAKMSAFSQAKERQECIPFA